MGSKSNDSKNLNKSKGSVDKLRKPKPLSLNELFTQHFMNSHTHYDTLHDFFRNGGFKITSTSLYKINSYVNETTEFSNFQEMLETAGEEFILDIISSNI